MTGQDLYRALNELDDSLIAEANEPDLPRKKSAGWKGRRWAGIAACAVLMVCLALAFPALRGELPFFTKQQSAAAAGSEATADLAILHDYKDIYYVDKDSGKIKKQSVLMDYTLENFFSEWKTLNRVSAGVKLLGSKVDSNGYEERTGSTVAYHVGDTTVLNLTLSKEFLQESNRAALMDTLEKTMQDRYSPYQKINLIVDGTVLNP